jgi:biotin carboxyl carrier protein
VIFDVEVPIATERDQSPSSGSAPATAGAGAARRIYRVDVRRNGAAEVVHVNGISVPVDVAAGGRSWSLLIGTRSYDVAVSDGPQGTTLVQVDGQTVSTTVAVVGRFGATAHRTRPAAERGDGPSEVVAPMPGRIVKVLVTRGDKVKARQPLVVVEAMKMENELRAPRDGVVADIRVGEGALVEPGAVLVVVDDGVD